MTDNTSILALTDILLLPVEKRLHAIKEKFAKKLLRNFLSW
jgi:hypothetical protein